MFIDTPLLKNLLGTPVRKFSMVEFRECQKTYTKFGAVNPTWGGIFERCFKVQTLLEGLFFASATFQ